MALSVPALSSATRVDFVVDFGAIGNGSTDNSGAWNRFAAYGQAQSALGLGVNLVLPPGVYNYDQSLCQNFIWNIKKLHIVGYGAKVQNTYSESQQGPNLLYSLVWPFSGAPNMVPGTGADALINTTAPGDTSVTLVTAAQTSRFTVGKMALIVSYDLYFRGYPPAVERFDFVTITAINAGTGVITFANDKLKYRHDSTFPDGNNDTCTSGKARIWDLNRNGLSNFDVEHIFEGFEMGLPVTSYNLSYIPSGKSVKLINCVTPGVGPSENVNFEIVGGKVTSIGEPDKCVVQARWTGVDLYDLIFQSGSFEHASLYNCNIRTQFAIGSVKSLYAENCVIDTLSEGPLIGSNRDATLVNCQVRSAIVGSLTNPTTIDGVDVQYANGTFKVTRIAMTLSNTITLITSLGQTISFVPNYSNGVFSGDFGTGRLVRVYEDATYIYLETTMTFSSVPAWAKSQVYACMSGQLNIINCFGCDAVRLASEAYRQGKQPWELHKFTWFGRSAASGYWQPNTVGMFMGNLTRILVNVIVPTAIAGAKIHFFCNCLNSATLLDLQDYSQTFDLTVAGVRDFTTAALTGKTANDSVTVAAVAQTSLPANRLYYGDIVNWALNYDPTLPATPNLLPTFTVQFEFDRGMYRKLITAGVDGTTNAIAGVTGGIAA